MYMYVHAYVYVCVNVYVFVSVSGASACTCVSASASAVSASAMSLSVSVCERVSVCWYLVEPQISKVQSMGPCFFGPSASSLFSVQGSKCGPYVVCYISWIYRDSRLGFHIQEPVVVSIETAISSILP